MDELENDLSDEASDFDRDALEATWAASARLDETASRDAAATEDELTAASDDDVQAASDDDAAAADSEAAAAPAALDDEL